MTRTELSPAQIKQLLQNPPAGMFLELQSSKKRERFRTNTPPLFQRCWLVINVNKISIITYLLIWEIVLNICIHLVFYYVTNMYVLK